MSIGRESPRRGETFESPHAEPAPIRPSPASLDEIKKSRKPVDAWWTVIFIDPLAVRMTWVLVRIAPWVTPGMLTFLSFVTGVGAAALFATDRLILGAVVFQVSFLFDCVDGKLARLRQEATPRGAFWDGLVNHSVYLLALLGLVSSIGTHTSAALAGYGLLSFRALHIYLNHYVPPARNDSWSAFAPRRGGWLERRRLLPPMSFPDKQAVLFGIAPLLDLVMAGILLNLAAEIVLLGAKIMRVPK